MTFDFRPAGHERHLVLYDPEAIPADFPADPDLEVQELEPPPKEAVETLAREGRTLVVEIPAEWDCEAGMRVFVDEAPPAELLERATPGSRVEGACLAAPSGTLVADGVEFLSPAGQHRLHASEERADLAPGHYRLDAFDTLAWKIAHRERHLRANTTWSMRQGARLMTVAALLGILLLGANVVALAVLGNLLVRDGWAVTARPALILLVIDVFFFGALWAYDLAARRSPGRDPLARTARVQEAFDAETPDIVVVLTRLEAAQPGSSPPTVLRVSA